MTHGSSRAIAVIPARAGSKRIPDKNIRAFAGRPLIAWAIALARESGLFERVVVSTDGPAIRDIALAEGAEAPFMRPADLADDHTTTAAVFAHALQAVGARDVFDHACCLYPACPFTRTGDLAAGLALVADAGARSAFAVAPFPAPVWRSFTRDDDATMRMIWPEHRDTRSQDLPEAYYDVGQFYWVDVGRFLDEPVLLGENARGVVYERWRAHDIDTMEDWVQAELIYRAMTEGGLS